MSENTCGTYENPYPNKLERKILVFCLIILVATYFSCLLLAIHNVYKYLICAGRWRIHLISIFYLLVVCILSTRALSLIYFIKFYINGP